MLDVVIGSMSRETFLLVCLEYYISHVLGSIPSSAGPTVERIAWIFCSLLYVMLDFNRHSFKPLFTPFGITTKVVAE